MNKIPKKSAAPGVIKVGFWPSKYCLLHLKHSDFWRKSDLRIAVDEVAQGVPVPDGVHAVVQFLDSVGAAVEEEDVVALERPNLNLNSAPLLKSGKQSCESPCRACRSAGPSCAQGRDSELPSWTWWARGDVPSPESVRQVRYSFSLSQGFIDQDLGNTPGLLVATASTYCPSRPSQLLTTTATKHCDKLDE